MEKVKIGVIGGSGLYKMPDITDITEYDIETPFGKPSAPVLVGTLRGKRVAFLPRHGAGHVFTPTTVPYRANICALKMLGVRHILAVNACGSLREDYAPGHIVIPDQLFDQTKHDRGNSFFETGMVAHISVADPFCTDLAQIAYDAVQSVGGTAHMGGRFVVVEGPRFSTRGESHIFRHLGCDIIGMTTCPEAFLAREAEICYATMAHVTDYDVWHTSTAPVTVEAVIETMHHNLAIAQQAVAEAIARLPDDHDCECHHTLDYAIMTDRSRIPSDVMTRLHPIAGRLFA
ncbi:MAG: S-methyl-5'-thioadenosine phosphorylase [Chloroflexota bacterium]|nr:S-methyl-5'-thioadenosine phosphorylase [Chloroflexota bacterium]